MASQTSVLLVMAALIAGCAPTAQNVENTVAAATAGTGIRPDVLKKLQVFDGQTEAQLISRYRNKTQIYFGPRYGTQIEYTSDDGKAYLWFPGNRNILNGEWKKKSQPGMHSFKSRTGDGKSYLMPKTEICFRYGKNTYNPVTGHRGGGFECQSVALSILLGKYTVLEGDVFALAGRKAVPFVLPSGTELNADAVRSRIDSDS